LSDGLHPVRPWLVAAILLAWQAVSGVAAVAQDVRAGTLVVNGAWARAVPADIQATEGFVVVRNTGPLPDRLMSAWSRQAETIQLRERDPASATAFRRSEDGLPIPAGGVLTMEPGGPHLAVTGLREPLGPGVALQVVLRFEQAGEVTVQLRGHDH
jgi:copper(I)-binding protein